MHLLTFSLPVMWLIILVVLALAEAATINLVSIWFAAGALTALLISLFCQNFGSSWLSFFSSPPCVWHWCGRWPRRSLPRTSVPPTLTCSWGSTLW